MEDSHYSGLGANNRFFVINATPNQYKIRNGMPGIKNKNRNSKPLGKFISVKKTTRADTIPAKLKRIVRIGLHKLESLSL